MLKNNDQTDDWLCMPKCVEFEYQDILLLCSIVQVFTNQRFAVECNQAKWVCSLVDFFMESSARQTASSE